MIEIMKEKAAIMGHPAGGMWPCLFAFCCLRFADYGLCLCLCWCCAFCLLFLFLCVRVLVVCLFLAVFFFVNALNCKEGGLFEMQMQGIRP
jgi:hypothetical protein